MFKRLIIIVILAISVGIAGFSYWQVGNLSEKLAQTQKELKSENREMYGKLDYQLDKITSNISQLKKEGYIEESSLTSAAKEVMAATVLVADSKDIEKIKKAGQSLILNTINLTGAGTGFILKEDGYIITAQHVVDVIDQDKITILTQENESYPANLVRRSEKSDIALLKIKAKNLPTVAIGYFDNISTGDQIGFIGFSLSAGITRAVVHSGTVSAKGLDESGMKIFGINAFVNRGNSGGPVFSLKTGRVIGMLSSRQRDVSSDQFIQLPSGYNSALMLGNIDPVKFNVDLYNQTVKLVGDASQVGIGLVYSLDGIDSYTK